MTKQFSCDDCDNTACTQPRKTVFGKPRYWSYKGACGYYKRGMEGAKRNKNESSLPSLRGA